LAAVLALTISVFAGARLGIRYQRLRIHIVDAEVAIGVRVGRVGSLLELNDVVPVVRVDRVRIVAIKLVQLVARIELVDRVYIDIVLPIIIAVIAGIRLPQGFNPNIIGVRIPIGPVLIVVTSQPSGHPPRSLSGLFGSVPWMNSWRFSRPSLSASNLASDGS